MQSSLAFSAGRLPAAAAPMSAAWSVLADAEAGKTHEWLFVARMLSLLADCLRECQRLLLGLLRNVGRLARHDTR